MMTSRSEFRLILRQDNADLRLTPLGARIGLADEARVRRCEAKRAETQQLENRLRETNLPESEARRALLEALNETDPQGGVSAAELLRRPVITLENLQPLLPWLEEYSSAAREQAQISLKYEGYLKKQQAQIAKTRAMENWLLPEGFDYSAIDGLRLEARQKLTRQQPRSLGQAGRIPGVSPADIAVLMVYLQANPIMSGKEENK